MTKLLGYILIFTMMPLASAHNDKEVLVDRTVKDEMMGEFKIKVVDLKESGAPYELTLDVLCKDRRVKKNSVLPNNRRVLRESTCEYRGYSFDDQKQLLTLHYSTLSPVRPGEFVAKCSESWAHTFDLNIECGPWKP